MFYAPVVNTPYWSHVLPALDLLASRLRVYIQLRYVFLTSQSNLLNNLDNLLEVLMKLQASF